ncbi:MAG: EAL domain-containing protein [Gammaproteobacteria bacterium]|nr:EAL domain-containing protein [Gammaproteobacteria bacterium]
MNEVKPGRRLGIGVGLGFTLMLILMLSLAFIGLTRMAATNQHLEDIVSHNMAKRELAFQMNLALLERLVSMHSLIVMTDVFDQIEEADRMREHGAKFLEQRQKLESMPLTAEEKTILSKIREQAVKTRPLTEQVTEEVLAGHVDQARITIRTHAIPAQAAVVQHVNEFIAVQQRDIERVIAQAAESYAFAQRLMFTLGGLAAGIGLLISIFVIRNTVRQARSLQHQAMFDNLTDLPNRTLFTDRLQQAILIGRREKHPFGLIVMDLNRFKEINDTLGHHVGDRVLQHVATCVRTCLRESDTVARMGGDEFVILLATVSDLNGAVAAAKKVLQSLSSPLDIAGRKLDIGASLGVVLFPQHGEAADVLLREADAAMYVAKQSHSGYRVYSDELGHGVDDRMALQGELQRAIANNELILYYQPKIDFSAERVNGVEALVRWQHPHYGLMLPDKFIPLAEQTGLIKPLTHWVLKTALRQSQAWRQAGLSLSVSINISAINVQDPEFPGQVAGLLAEFPVPPALLELELTETAVMSEPARAVECIRKLSALGLQIAIDDFGTGYSSMAYLKELLVAKIKIDKSFVTNMAVNHNDAVIVRSTVELGHNLGLKVIAEGVEDQVVWDRLKGLGCDSAQGYYMSHPLPPDEFLEWLKRSPWG